MIHEKIERVILSLTETDHTNQMRTFTVQERTVNFTLSGSYPFTGVSTEWESNPVIIGHQKAAKYYVFVTYMRTKGFSGKTYFLQIIIYFIDLHLNTSAEYFFLRDWGPSRYVSIFFNKCNDGHAD